MIIEIDTVYGRISNDKKFLVANYVSETNAMNVTKTECNFILAKRYFGGKLLLRVVAAALLLVYTKNCIFLQTCHCDFAINALLRLFFRHLKYGIITLKTSYFARCYQIIIRKYIYMKVMKFAHHGTYNEIIHHRKMHFSSNVKNSYTKSGSIAIIAENFHIGS